MAAKVLRLSGHKLTITWSGEYGIESSSTGECACGWTESASNQREVRFEYRRHVAKEIAKRVLDGENSDDPARIERYWKLVREIESGEYVYQPRKLKCYECGEGKPFTDTTMIGAMIGGDYRRAARHGQVRVCRDCAQHQLDFCVQAQAENRAFAVNTGRMTWTTALTRFGIEIPPGTLIDRMTGRRA